MTSFKKKVLTYALVSAMALGNASIASAATTPSKYDTIKELGIIQGEGTGTDANKPMTRYRGFLLQLKMMGLYNEMVAYNSNGKQNFTDAEELGGLFINLGTYLKNEFKVQGYPGNKFMPYEELTSIQYYIMMLNSLGYVSGVDFTWETVAKTAVTAGLAKSESDVTGAVLTEEQVADITYDALAATPKNSEHSLGETIGYPVADTTAPVGTFDEIASETTDESIKISGSFNEAVTLKINGIAVTMNEDNSFEADVNLLLGDNSIIIIATDLAGNKSEKEFEIVRKVNELKVDSVIADSLKMVKVQFNTELDPATVLDANFEIEGFEGNSKAKLADDNKTVLVILTEADNGTDLEFVQSEDYKFTSIKNVKSAKGIEMNKFENQSFTVRDLAFPTADKVEFLKNNEVRITFSEPVKRSFAYETANYILNGEKLIGAISGYDYNTVDIYCAQFKAENELTISNMRDYNNGKMATTTLSFEYQADSSAPQILRAYDTTLESVKIQFSEAIDVSSINLSKIKWAYTSGQNGRNATDFEVLSKDTVLFYFSMDNAIPSNSNDTILVINDVKDLSGNTIATDAKVKIVAQVDNERPQVSKVTVDQDDSTATSANNGSTKITVNFDKKVKDGDDIAGYLSNFALTNASGDEIDLSFADVVEPFNKIEINVDDLTAGSYNLSVKGMKDATVLGNQMIPYSQTINIANKKTPSVVDVYYDNNNKLYVEFSESMNTTIADASRYMLVSQANGAYQTLSSRMSGSISTMNNGTIAVIQLKDAPSNYSSIEITGVQNSAGNTLQGLKQVISKGEFQPISNIAPFIESASVTAHNQLKVYLSREVVNPYYKDLKVFNTLNLDNSLSPVNYVNTTTVRNCVPSTEEVNGKRVTVFTFTFADNTFNASGEFVVNTNAAGVSVAAADVVKYTKDAFGNLLNSGVAGVTAEDKISPTLAIGTDRKVAAENTALEVFDGADNVKVTLSFNEDLNDSVDGIAYLYNDLVVTNKDGSALRAGSDYKAFVVDGKLVVYIKKAKLDSMTGTIKIKSAGAINYMKDANSNSANAFSDVLVNLANVR